MRIQCVIGLLLLVHAPSFGQHAVGARSEGMSGMRTGMGDAWSATHDPAQLAAVGAFSMALTYRFQRFVPEIAHVAGAFTQPIGKGGIGVYAETYGLAGFRYSQAAIGYGLQLSEQFRLGVQLRGHHYRFGKTYGASFRATACIGMNVQASDKLQLSTVIVNPGRSRLGASDDERLPMALIMGLSQTISDHSSMFVEIEKNLQFPLDMRVGVEYSNERLSLRTGISTLKRQFSLGLGIALSRMDLRLAQAYGLNLGGTSAVDLHYQRKRSEG